MSDELPNPFKQSRASIPTTNSLLTYGEDSFSFYSRLQTPRLNRSQTVYLSQKETVQNIIHKFQREMYSMDESGHCLAENAIDDMITQDGQKQQDFWQKIKVMKPKKQVQNPFDSSIGSRSYTKRASLFEKTTVSSRRGLQQMGKMQKTRKTARQDMVKWKEVIKRQKLKQENIQKKTQRFSLVDMYKTKRQQQRLTQTVSSLLPIKTETQIAKPSYPVLIVVRNVLYQRVEMQN